MRCFSHVEDCLSCLLAMGLSERGLGEVVNIGPDEEFISINALFRLLKGIVGFEGQAIHLKDRPQEVKKAFCSSARARDLLGYRTTRSAGRRAARHRGLHPQASARASSATTWISRFATRARRAPGPSGLM